MVRDDPLLVKLGLHEYLGSTAVGRTSVQTYDNTLTEFVRPAESYPVQPAESYPVRGFSTVENDELIAHVYQEELATKDAAEASERPQGWSEWLGSYADPWSSGAVPHNDYDPNSNFDYDSQQSSEDEDEDEDEHPDEIGRRLHHMGSIPHVPKINGEIPTVDESTDAHQRLLDRLKLYGLHELKMDGDGNCQFRAISDQLYQSPSHHKSVRDGVVTQLTAHPEYYEEYVPMKYSDYVKKMALSGEWGDHVTLQAAADFYGVRICLLTSFKDTSFIEILPREMKSSKRVIFLSFWSEVHYNSVYADGGAPLYFENKRRKKRHWRQYFKDKLKLSME